MLASCDTVLMVVEGFYDAVLVSLLTGRRYRIVYSERLRDATRSVWECLATRGRCLSIYPLGGLSRLEEAAPKLGIIARMASAAASGTCLAVVVDSDEHEPSERVERVAPLVGIGSGAVVGDQYFAETCSAARGGPRVCVAAWRCSAECWLSLLTQSPRVVSLLDCGPQARARCHEEAARLLGDARGVERAAERLASLARERRGPWTGLYDSLRRRLLDGRAVVRVH